MFTKTLAGLALAAVASLGFAGAAQAGITPALQNVGGYTPNTSTLAIAPHQITGLKGAWANAGKSSVTITITGGAAVSGAYCHVPVDEPGEKYFCYVYDATGKVTGTFRTIPGAQAARAGQRITRAMKGTFTAQLHWSFYGQSYPRLHPGTLTMSLNDAYKEFFGAGTRFGGKGLVSSVWTYRIPACGQTLTVMDGAYKGSITGC